MKECQFCHYQTNKKIDTCPLCKVAGSFLTLTKEEDPYRDYRDHVSRHFEGRPRNKCKYCDNRSSV